MASSGQPSSFEIAADRGSSLDQRDNVPHKRRQPQDRFAAAAGSESEHPSEEALGEVLTSLGVATLLLSGDRQGSEGKNEHEHHRHESHQEHSVENDQVVGAPSQGLLAETLRNGTEEEKKYEKLA